MIYQDNKRVQTAEELKRMYNLDNLSKDRRAISNNTNSLTKVENEQNNILKSIIINVGDNLKNQGEISLWFFNGTPTLENSPTIDWTIEEDKIEHLGDLYYDKDTGYVYMFEQLENEFIWNRKEDKSLIQAMALTNSEIDSIDNIRKVFFTTPTPPYDNGDWYIKDGDLYICQISKNIDEIYSENDFIIAPKYTDDTKANEVAGTLTIVSGQVTTIVKNLEIISQTIEDNRYYIDEKGNKHLITQAISELNQSVDNIESKISSVADFTRISSGIKTIKLVDCLECNLLELHIYGNNEVFQTLYLSDDLYLSDNLYLHSGDSKLAITNENGEVVIYDLGIKEVLRKKDDIYDEYVNENGKAKIIRRINENGELLEKEKIEELSDLLIYLLPGKNTIMLEEYNANIEIKYVLKSDFSDVYATRIEMNSSIKQTADSINLEVSKKVDNDEIISKINQSAEKIQIDANKISLTGKTIDLTSDKILINSKNFQVDINGNMKCNNAELTGIFKNYDNNNNLAIKIDNQLIQLYDYQGNQQIVGEIASTYDSTSKISGISLHTFQGERLILGYKSNSSSTNINTIISFDTNDLTSTPWIKNTASGTLMKNDDYGIIVEHGLIKSWNMPSGATGELYLADSGSGAKVTITVRDGLITGWSVE